MAHFDLSTVTFHGRQLSILVPWEPQQREYELDAAMRQTDRLSAV